MLRKCMMAFLVFGSFASGMIWPLTYLIAGKENRKNGMVGFALARTIGDYRCYLFTMKGSGGVYVLTLDRAISDAPCSCF